MSDSRIVPSSHTGTKIHVFSNLIYEIKRIMIKREKNHAYFQNLIDSFFLEYLK